MHEYVCERAIERLSRFPEASQLILYGSVMRGEHGPGSDVDIAFICDDSMRMFPLDLEGYPLGLRERIDRALGEMDTPRGIDMHVPIYWQQEFDTGIRLSGGENQWNERLDEVGQVVYSRDGDLYELI